MSRQGVSYSADQHSDILLQLDPEDLQRAYLKRFPTPNAIPSPIPSKTESVISAASSPRAPRTPRMMRNRNLTAPQDTDTQSVRSYGSLLSSFSSSPGSSWRRDQRVKDRLIQKKTSLPMNYSLAPMVSDAMSLASEHIGDQANLSAVQVVKSPEASNSSVRKTSVFGRSKKNSENMELRFTFSAADLASSKLGNSDDILRKIVEQLEEQKGANVDENVGDDSIQPVKEAKSAPMFKSQMSKVDENVEDDSREPVKETKTSRAPMLSQMDKSLTVPAFVMTVVDTEDENMDPEGMVIGPPSSKMSVDGKPSAKISSTSVSTNANENRSRSSSPSREGVMATLPDFSELQGDSSTDPEMVRYQETKRRQSRSSRITMIEQERETTKEPKRRRSRTISMIEDLNKEVKRKHSRSKSLIRQRSRGAISMDVYDDQTSHDADSSDQMQMVRQKSRMSLIKESNFVQKDSMDSSGIYSMPMNNRQIDRKISNMSNHQLQLPYQTLGVEQSFDARSMISTRSAISRGSFRTGTVVPNLPKSDEERQAERKDKFLDSLANIYSLVYGIAIIVVGLVMYIFDHASKMSKLRGYPPGTLSESFNLFLCIAGIGIISVLLYDINSYLNSLKNYQAQGEESKFKLIEGEDGELIISIPLMSSKNKKLPQYYLFTTGRHSGSFYMKIGAAIFCMGHMIHMLIIFTKEIKHYQNRREGTELECYNPVGMVTSLTQAVFVFLQLYMIFKFSNVIVNRKKRLARICFMHCIASSVCFWISAIINETVDSMINGLRQDFNATDHFNDLLRASDKPCSDYIGKCFKERDHATFGIEFECLYEKMCSCVKQQGGTLESFYDITAYLYPFTIEFSILAAGVWYIMWSKIGKVAEHQQEMEFVPHGPRGSFDSSASASTKQQIQDSLYIYADCHAAVKGTFFGFLFFLLSFVGIIIFMIMDGEEDVSTTLYIDDSIELILLLVMFGTALWVYRSIYQLEVNPSPISLLDDLLLIICQPAFFMIGIFNIIVGFGQWGIKPGLEVSVFTNIVMLLQVAVQTPMIIDGLRRCSDSRENQTLKPGRNTLTFLIIANLALWLWDTMELKTGGYATLRKDYYGEDFYTVVSHMTMPLVIFYRFHSSVAMVDIWSSAYRPGTHH